MTNNLVGYQQNSFTRGFFWVHASWKIFSAEWKMWLLFALVQLLCNLVIASIPGGGTIVNVFLSAGAMYAVDKQLSGDKLQYKDWIFGVENRVKPLFMMALFYLLGGLICVVVSLPFLALIFLNPNEITHVVLVVSLVSLIFFALILPLIMAEIFAPYLIVHRQMDAKSAMMASFRGCMKNILPFLAHNLYFFALIPVVFLTCGLFIFALGPIFYISIYVSARDIFPGKTLFEIPN
ncbi:MAG: BPSS1780 family membrane protein [Myxococcota bacterium]|nr:BPSS1780 family membrane protein [Myxococcota bacterium]